MKSSSAEKYGVRILAMSPLIYSSPPVLEDNIASLSHSFLEGTVQVVQTSRTVHLDPRDILEVSFVIPYVELSDDNKFLEVFGTEFVRVLCGRLHNGCFDEFFTPSFLSSCQ
jgi:hypothetical protein